MSRSTTGTDVSHAMSLTGSPNTMQMTTASQPSTPSTKRTPESRVWLIQNQTSSSTARTENSLFLWDSLILFQTTRTTSSDNQCGLRLAS